MKTAGRENQNCWGTMPGNRVYGAAGQKRSDLISWAAKQEKMQPAWLSFFLTSPFIELTGKVPSSTPARRKNLKKNKISQRGACGCPRAPGAMNGQLGPRFALWKSYTHPNWGASRHGLHSYATSLGAKSSSIPLCRKEVREKGESASFLGDDGTDRAPCG